MKLVDIDGFFIACAARFAGSTVSNVARTVRCFSRFFFASGQLMVLDRHEIPLHTNGSENDVRCQVIRRKASGGTRSDAGRDCHDGDYGHYAIDTMK